jgi:hypothetical protein
VNWLSALGFDCYGMADLAKKVREASTKVVAMSPFPREYYNPITGGGLVSAAASPSESGMRARRLVPFALACVFAFQARRARASTHVQRTTATLDFM